MEIACSTDNNYVMPTGVMMCSLCENNKNENITFHVLSSDVNEQNKKKLENLVRKYKQKIIFYYVDDKDCSYFPINQPGQSEHIHSLAAYYRLLLHEILPQNIQKVLYLDGDIIVRHSLEQLWETDIDNYAIAAAPDIQNNRIKHYNRLKYPYSLGYFNSGVLLINLYYWRKNNVANEFYDFATKYPERLACHDQDVLNYVFRNRKYILDVTYNFQQDFFYKKELREFSNEIEAEIESSIHDPVLIHYIWRPKPWYKDCTHPCKNEFEKYRALTEWSCYKEKYFASYKERFKLFVKEILVKTKIINTSHLPSSKYE